jgi:hypothetical protein
LTLPSVQKTPGILSFAKAANLQNPEDFSLRYHPNTMPTKTRTAPSNRNFAMIPNDSAATAFISKILLPYKIGGDTRTPSATKTPITRDARVNLTPFSSDDDKKLAKQLTIMIKGKYTNRSRFHTIVRKCILAKLMLLAINVPQSWRSLPCFWTTDVETRGNSSLFFMVLCPLRYSTWM